MNILPNTIRTRALRSIIKPNYCILGTTRHLTNSTSTSDERASSDHYRVVIVGGGAGGMSVAHQLANSLPGEKMALIEPSETHYYQPLWTLIGAGLKQFSDSARPTETLVPRGVEWLCDKVIKIKPQPRRLELARGDSVSYDYLVLAPGVKLRLDSVKGLQEAVDMRDPSVVSIYHYDAVKRVWPAIRAARSSNRPFRAIFTMPQKPVKCPGAPQKIMYLADHEWRRVGLHTDIHYYAGVASIFAVQKYAQVLQRIVEDRHLNTHFLHELESIDPKEKTATFVKTNLPPTAPASANLPHDHVPGEKVTVPYDLLHVTPQMSAPSFIGDSGLADASGAVDVDKSTLQHVRDPRVFALGDASSLPTSKTAAAIAAQAPVLVDNLLCEMSGRPATATYNGYASCPLITGPDSALLAEFSGYTLQPLETFPIDQSVERKSLMTLTSQIIPFIYFEGMVKRGLWKGPAPFREMLDKVRF